MNNQIIKVGLDVGSTTVKLCALDIDNNILFKSYKRHFSNIKITIEDMFNEAYVILKDCKVSICVTGSGGLGVAKWLDIPFEQEVVASTRAIETFIPRTDVVIELGGEDAKITYLEGSIEQRMNGTCAGGTGAFIDQMASLLKTDAMGLNEYAKDYMEIYPIASRCGVFAKTDIQPLLNEGARKEDIAVSIFQAVVNQTVSGLACGRPIKGNVAFLGGPLFFLSELRKRFAETLKLDEEAQIFPENAELFVSIGAALLAKGEPIQFKELGEKFYNKKSLEQEIKRLDALFENEEEYLEFCRRHDNEKVSRKKLENYYGKLFLGIDAGSTTTKVVLIDEDDQLLYEVYRSNDAKPLETTIDIIKDIYNLIKDKNKIVCSLVTGYGEALLKKALHIDYGEIETVAHYKAAAKFLRGVDFILDIGGQDMKCLKIKNDVIDSIMLNEACSSGCGSFLETFANSLKIDIRDFAKEALFAKEPIDLGSRCTVFMNSRVKQAQKEGASVGEISAGLSYSVIKNALNKVIKIRNPEDMGEKIIVQGGTFNNDSVLRAFEKLSGKEAIRPDIAGVMGAYGAAMLAKEKYYEGYESSLLPIEKLSDFSIENEIRRCDKCTNHCLLTINKFSTNETFISGNRCERGLGIEIKQDDKDIPDLYEYKYKRTFSYYQSLNIKDARFGEIGIPRILGMYENYPFWHTFLTKIGFKVVLSPRSSKRVFEMGMASIPSESVCYPAKLAHGHVSYLIDRGIKTIFAPCIPYERNEFEESNNHYNCPVVTSYSEVLSANMEEIKEHEVNLMKPFLALDDEKKLKKRLFEVFKSYKVTFNEVKLAVELAYGELENYKRDIQKEGERAIEYIREHKLKAIVLAGRPYHVDPEINHGIPSLIKSYNMAVLTEDSVSHLEPVKRPLRVVDQWMYHTRLYAAASFVSKQDDIEIVQLNSFGCGLDAVTTDQVEEILEKEDKIYTCLKIDEGNNLGAARIRIRSLKAAMLERDKNCYNRKPNNEVRKEPIFTKEMKKDYTIIAPQMSPIHFELVEKAFDSCGYNFKILPSVDYQAVDEGLKHVNNDACYPSILTTGQLVHALKSGEYDPDKTAVIISQTGGGCRATNYIGFIKKALLESGFGQVPVLSLNALGFEKHPGFKVNLRMLKRGIMALVYGDLFMRLLYKVRPYEKVKGSADKLYKQYNEICKKSLVKGNMKEYRQNIYQIVEAFDKIAIYEDLVKPKVGIVGEILVKYHPTANNEIVKVLEREGAEVVSPDLLDFFLYSAYSPIFKFKYLSGSLKGKLTGQGVIQFLEMMRGALKSALEKSERFNPPETIYHLANKAKKILSLGNQTGEGWFLTAEMIELIESGVSNIVCMQPFACLPNHVTGKGMIKALRDRYQSANIVPIDFDPGASEVNQLNRIKLMLANAKKSLQCNNDKR